MNIFRGQVEVEIGGEKRLLKFGINALAFLSEETGKDLSDLKGGLEAMRDLIWAGLKAGAAKRREDFTYQDEENKKMLPISLYTVGDWIEEMEQSEFDKITEAINLSMPKSDGKEAKKK